ncbi:hypothetical protein EAF04_003956 [Stromatinia cepivora]|nr:hypothetical protein EAF04_003956 [Stromatinia cepivora]
MCFQQKSTAFIEQACGLFIPYPIFLLVPFSADPQTFFFNYSGYEFVDIKMVLGGRWGQARRKEGRCKVSMNQSQSFFAKAQALFVLVEKDKSLEKSNVTVAKVQGGAGDFCEEIEKIVLSSINQATLLMGQNLSCWWETVVLQFSECCREIRVFIRCHGYRTSITRLHKETYVGKSMIATLGRGRGVPTYNLVQGVQGRLREPACGREHLSGLPILIDIHASYNINGPRNHQKTVEFIQDSSSVEAVLTIDYAGFVKSDVEFNCRVTTNNENGSNSTTSTPLSGPTSAISVTLTEPIFIAENLEVCPSVESLVQDLEGHQFGSLDFTFKLASSSACRFFHGSRYFNVKSTLKDLCKISKDPRNIMDH